MNFQQIISKEIEALKKVTKDKSQPKEKRETASKYLWLYKINNQRWNIK